jgi:CubicO group peptidase (beta-lactamase class C family)
MSPERIERARERCAEWVATGHTLSLAVCVARRGVIVLDEAFGRSGPGAAAPPLSRDSLFPVASVTKAITATLVMQMVEDGILGLNRPAVEYLPELAAGKGNGDILVHHLLTHTAGYPWHTDPSLLLHAAAKLEAGTEISECPPNQHPATHRALELLWDAPRCEPVGAIMTYSNHNYVLLGEILRRLSGRSLEELARDRIFDPAGMHDSFYVVPESAADRVVQRPPEAPFSESNDFYPALGSRAMQRNPDAGMGVFTTPRDMVTFGQIFLDGGRAGDARILSRATVEAMTRDQIPGLSSRLMDVERPNASWGYGWSIESPTKWRYFRGSLISLGSFTHPGAGGAAFWVDPRRELVGAYFEVCMRITDDWEFRWNFDLFENVITSAVE